MKPGWTRVAFGDVVRQVKDRVAPETSGLDRYIAGEHMDTDDLRIRRWGTIDDGYLGPAFHMRFKPGQVLYGSRRTYLRKVAVPDFEGICANTTFVLESKDPTVLIPELLPFIMQTEAFHDHSIKQSKGSVNPYVNFSDLAWYEFALPPLEEQRRISRLLLSVETVRQHIQDAVHQGWKSRVAAYAHITQRGNTESSYKNSVIGEVPSCWEVMPVGDAVQIVNNLRKPISESERSEIQGKYPYYGPTGQLDSLNEYRLDGTYALIGEDGDHFLKYAVWSMTQLIHGRNNVNNHAHVIRGTKYCSTEWFFHYFRHRDVRQWLTKQGSGRLKLKKKDLEQIPITVPPLDIQLQLVDALGNSATASERLNLRLQATVRLLDKILNSSLGVS